MNNFSGLFTHHMDTQKTPVIAMIKELKKPYVVTDNFPAWNVRISASPYNVRDLPFDQRFLGLSDETCFRDGVDTGWQQSRKTATPRLVKGMTNSDASLFDASRGERGSTDDIPGCIDVRRFRRLVVWSHLY